MKWNAIKVNKKNVENETIQFDMFRNFHLSAHLTYIQTHSWVHLLIHRKSNWLTLDSIDKIIWSIIGLRYTIKSHWRASKWRSHANIRKCVHQLDDRVLDWVEQQAGDEQAKDIKCSWVRYLHEIASECRIRTIVDLRSWKQLDDLIKIQDGEFEFCMCFEFMLIYVNSLALLNIYTLQDTLLSPFSKCNFEAILREIVRYLRKIPEVFHTRGKCDFSFIVSLPQLSSCLNRYL